MGGRQPKDLTGKTFGRLKVVGYIGSDKHKRAVWECQCTCGNVHKVNSNLLQRGVTRSCGCLRRDTASVTAFKHGKSDSRVYVLWSRIVAVCGKPSNPKYKYYGGRGIRVAQKWATSFETFEAYVTQLPNFGRAAYSLDRINNDGNYEPGNVRWASKTTQARNNRNAKLTLAKVREIRHKRECSGITVQALAQEYGVSVSTVERVIYNLAWKDEVHV